MADFMRLWESVRQPHRADYYVGVKEADDNRLPEQQAAVMMQALWRGHTVRNMIAHWHKAATDVQRVYKGFKARKKRRLDAIESLRQRRHTAYHGGATKLQALWRGHRSRQADMTRDARGRAKFLAGIAVGCDEMQAKLDAYLAARKRWAKEQRDAKVQAQYQDRLNREHHMISTTSKTGVYGQETRKPGITRPKEADLASHVRSLNLTKSGRQFASSGPGLHAVEKAGRDARALTMTASLKRPQGPFRPPAEVWSQRHKPLKPSLRAQTQFEHVALALEQDKQAEWLKRQHDKGFHPSPAKGASFSPYPQSLNSASGYTGIQVPTFRETKPGGGFSTTVRPIPVLDEFNRTY